MLYRCCFSGEIRQRRPRFYQEIENLKREVEGKYFIIDGSQVGFQLSDYDKAERLIIDPVLVYSTYLGNSGDGKMI